MVNLGVASGKQASASDLMAQDVMEPHGGKYDMADASRKGRGKGAERIS